MEYMVGKMYLSKGLSYKPTSNHRAPARELKDGRE